MASRKGTNIAEVRSQKSEVRSQKSEVRSQKSEVRSQKSEVKLLRFLMQSASGGNPQDRNGALDLGELNSPRVAPLHRLQRV
ncbi:MULTISPECIES: hypothetical protein [Moorena]|uniref:Uncharacterized protein n=1 Tax=Moorena producens 3L TaxID=489825 RepID=F4XQW2_9CYAN|nr:MULTISPECIES: hypothetical protein [Moorena]EGJ32937.1 hypothetical protein LYNGBM3L_55990 [Moorena producens 3L]NEP64069.1 hypothetical protein [Moorena sp. SIO3A5]NEQ05070.1 hypothetical protein [Moorena sp. SIO4E2]NET63407.1 hypothetical protein [Moorena sp. SIO1G6]